MKRIPKDYYIQNPDELNGKPKETLGRYAEKNGLLVPTILPNADEALRFGKDVVARSEHLFEYVYPGTTMGYSDFSKSFILKDKSQLLHPKVDERFLGPRLTTPINELVNDIEGQLQFSFWEHIPGVNVSVVADSGIEGRIHIYMKKKVYLSYCQVNKGKISLKYNAPSELVSNGIIENIVDIYSTVQGLERFDPANCPIVELQVADSDQRVYFLQYLRTQDKFYNEFSLRKLRGAKKLKAGWVRGATPKGGIVFNLSKGYFEKDLQRDLPSEEYILRKANTVHFFPGDGSEYARGTHYSLSSYFKPGISTYFPLKFFKSFGIIRGADFRIYSNGHEAYVLDIREYNPMSKKHR